MAESGRTTASPEPHEMAVSRKGKENIPVDEPASVEPVDEFLPGQTDDENDDLVIYKETSLKEDDIVMSSQMYIGFPVVLDYADEKFLVFAVHSDHGGEWSEYPVLIQSSDMIYDKMEAFFPQLRNGFIKLHAEIPLESELVLHWPDLGLEIGEDNVYNNEVSFSDIVALFNQLNVNSPADVKRHYMSMSMLLKHRFSSQFNSILELVSSGKGFQELDLEDSDSLDSKKHSLEPEFEALVKKQRQDSPQ